MKIGYVQSAPRLNELHNNIAELQKLISQGKQADLLVLPELANSGYNFRNRTEAFACSEEVGNGRFHDFISETASLNKQVIITGINERAGTKLYNSAVMYDRKGKLAGHYRKLHLFMHEKDFFEPGNTGLPVFDIEGIKIGIQVCFDWAFPESWRLLALKGAQIIAHPSNLVLPYAQQVIPSYALLNKTFIITANRVGEDYGLRFTGQSVIAGTKGDVIRKAGADCTETAISDVDINDVSLNITAKNHIFEDRRTDVYQLYEPSHD